MSFTQYIQRIQLIRDAIASIMFISSIFFIWYDFYDLVWLLSGGILALYVDTIFVFISILNKFETLGALKDFVAIPSLLFYCSITVHNLMFSTTFDISLTQKYIYTVIFCVFGLVDLIFVVTSLSYFNLYRINVGSDA